MDGFECPICIPEIINAYLICQPKCSVIICGNCSQHIKKCIWCHEPTNPIKIIAFDRSYNKNKKNDMFEEQYIQIKKNVCKMNDNLYDNKTELWSSFNDLTLYNDRDIISIKQMKLLDILSTLPLFELHYYEYWCRRMHGPNYNHNHELQIIDAIGNKILKYHTIKNFRTFNIENIN